MLRLPVVLPVSLASVAEPVADGVAEAEAGVSNAIQHSRVTDEGSLTGRGVAAVSADNKGLALRKPAGPSRNHRGN